MSSFIDQFRMRNLEARLDLRRLTCVNLALALHASLTAERRTTLAELLQKCTEDMEALQQAIERLKQSKSDEREAQFDEAQSM